MSLSATSRATQQLDPATRRAVLRRWAIGILVWGVAAAALSLSGALSRMPPLVPPALVVAGIAIPLLVVLRSPVQRAIVQRVNMAHLTWFNVWRVPAAAFFALGSGGLLPPLFVANARGDLLAGLAAPLVILGAARLSARSKVRAYLAFHLFSFGDFVLAVGTGLTLTVLGDPLMDTLLNTPMALVPLWGVPITGAISLLALHRLITIRA